MSRNVVVTLDEEVSIFSPLEADTLNALLD